MNETNCMQKLCQTITTLRKDTGMTQEQFASKLGVTFQAVSKWENGLSCPDITLIPEIAEIFKISIDELFGITSQTKEVDWGIDWEDNGKLRVAVFIGKKYITRYNDVHKFTFEYKGPALDVISSIAVSCGDVEGDVSAGGSVNAGDISGDVSANGSVNAGDIEGDISSNGNVNAGDIDGDIQTNGNVNAGNIQGSVSTNGNVKAQEITGNVYAEKVESDAISGDVHCVTREQLSEMKK
jgi:transcriptional regulator with XRE-family HTH domain/cytoskeletal protein CcmA (bactofilin family)